MSGWPFGGALSLACTSGPPVTRRGQPTRRHRLGSALRPPRATAICTREFPTHRPSEHARPMAQQYIFQMQGLTKAFPGSPKKLFENIWLSFYPDAKIGVVGVNGSGKSTLLKIMSGIDKDFSGEAFAADGIKRGYLEQEPQLDEKLDVWGNVISWCEEKKLFDKYNEIATRLGEDYSDELMEEMTALQEKLDAGDLWDID